MNIARFTDYLIKLEKENSRNELTQILVSLLKETSAEETTFVCYLVLGNLGPSYSRVQFNLAEKLMVKVIARAYGEATNSAYGEATNFVYGKEEKELFLEYKNLGDLGELAEKLAPKGKGKGMTVLTLYNRLLEIAEEKGVGSVERKISKMAILLGDLSPQSARFIARMPVGRLRLGFSELTILDVLSFVLSGDKSKRQTVEKAYNVRADIGYIAKLVKEKGLGGLAKIKVSLGTPIMPALCQRLTSPEEMIEKMGKVAVEPKYDGTRLQIHFSRKKKEVEREKQQAFGFRPKGFVQTFTRNLEETTHMFPDLIEAIFSQVKASEAILDSEAIGFNPKTGKFLPFQETIKRKRKYDIDAKIKEVPLKLFCFDLLYLDGRDLLQTPFNKRRKLLEKILPSKSKTIFLSPQILTEDPEVLRAYHDEQIKAGLEGVVVKKWESAYEPGRRGWIWVKFKQEDTKKGGGLADTIDCVVMGYYKGKGKRADFGIGAFLVGIRKNDLFLTVSKIGTGLSDEQWREMEKRCLANKAKEVPKQYRVHKNLIPDVWCEPSLVVEIQADNITKSPTHTASYAFRFPRLVRFRDDRSPEEATDLEELERLYKLQG